MKIRCSIPPASPTNTREVAASVPPNASPRNSKGAVGGPSGRAKPEARSSSAQPRQAAGRGANGTAYASLPTLLSLILILVLIGFALYAAETYIPMSPPIKLVLRVVVVILIVLWLLQVFGISDLPVPKLR